MQTLRRSEPYKPSASLPLWTLWAVAPLVVAFGIIGGMAAATYLSPASSVRPAPTGPTETAQSPAQPAPLPAVQPVPGAPVSVFTPPSTEGTGRIETVSPSQTAATPIPGQTPDAQRRVMTTLTGAKAELDQYFSYYTDSGATVRRIEYQLLTNTGFSTSLVGMISVSDYEGWAAALTANPGHLKAWLETAAARVRPALESERAFLAWAVLEVRRDKPAGFTDGEVKLLKDGTYLVTRPLAATADPGQTSVAIRPFASIGEGAAAAGAAGPWVTYGPQVRFDSTDKYRPTGPAGR